MTCPTTLSQTFPLRWPASTNCRPVSSPLVLVQTGPHPILPSLFSLTFPPRHFSSARPSINVYHILSIAILFIILVLVGSLVLLLAFLIILLLFVFLLIAGVRPNNRV